jgi:hypothetical protein
MGGRKPLNVPYRWSPELDLNSPRLVNPFKPSTATKRRHRLLLAMLLESEDFTTVDKMLAGYPYLREEYAARVTQAKQDGETRRRLVKALTVQVYPKIRIV